MRADKLTTKFQEALADAQSLANVSDNAYMEPQHLLVALSRVAQVKNGPAKIPVTVRPVPTFTVDK